jgi:hypothetical protein
MANPYVNVSNAFRQPTIADTYISLIVEALMAFGNAYSTPRETAVIANYIQTTYPVFPLDLAYLNQQLSAAVSRGVLHRCGTYWLLREDLTVVNGDNWKYLLARCSYGGALLRTPTDIGDLNARGLLENEGGNTTGSFASSKDCVDNCGEVPPTWT